MKQFSKKEPGKIKINVFSSFKVIFVHGTEAMDVDTGYALNSCNQIHHSVCSSPESAFDGKSRLLLKQYTE